MNRFIPYLFGFLVLAQANALACNFKIINFGDNINKLKIEPQPLSFPDSHGGVTVVVPISFICENNEILFGTTVNYLFIEKKLVLITLDRPLFKDRNLMDFAMEKYGKFEIKPAGMDRLKWRGSHRWEIGNEKIRYTATDIFDGQTELVEIHNVLYGNLLSDYFEKVGKWLDTQK